MKSGLRHFTILLCLSIPILGFECSRLAQAETATPKPSAHDAQRVLTGWGGGEPEKIVPRAARIGFREIVVWNQDPSYLKKLVATGQKEGIAIFASLTLSDVAAWKAHHPHEPIPLQEMNKQEQDAFNRIGADRTPGKSQYQVGGEPVQSIEVLTTPLLCFHDPRVIDLFKRQIRNILNVPGIRGVAFDFFGYQNYRCCRCARSMALFDRYKATHPKTSKDVALNDFSLETLVAFNNELADYVRTVRPSAKVINHVYPVFLPEPLYGNRLDVDVCGQTAAWFFEPYWSLGKITRYSHVINSEAKRYYPRPCGAALIGYFNQPKLYSVKPSSRVDAELNAILAGGCSRVHVCTMNNVLDNPQVAEVFRKYFGPPPAANTKGSP